MPVTLRSLLGWLLLPLLFRAGPVELERNNWVVLVDTSRYFYNYRHVANTLVLYHTIKRLGIPDSQIILMLAEDIPCNSRTAQPGMVFRDNTAGENLYGEDVEVDYRGDEVSIENFIRLLTGRHPPSTPRSKRLLTDPMSNILIYITGHSGEEFIKFQDSEELTSTDVADAFQQMHKQKRYGNIFWISDTCQAATLQNRFYTPGVLAYGSASKGENSYSHHADEDIGVAVIDRWTFHAYEFFKRVSTSSSHSVEDFVNYFHPHELNAHPQLRSDLFSKPPSQTRLTEFFASTGRMRFQSALVKLASSTASLVVGPSCPPPELMAGGCRVPAANDRPKVQRAYSDNQAEALLAYISSKLAPARTLTTVLDRAQSTKEATGKASDSGEGDQFTWVAALVLVGVGVALLL